MTEAAREPAETKPDVPARRDVATAGATRPRSVPEQPDGEVNGPKGPEPTRFGDWETNGRCSDF